MGVYIPGMSKPTACEKCPAHSFTFGDEYISAHDYCGTLKKRFNVKKLDIDPFKETLPDCLLIDIPEDVERILYHILERHKMYKDRDWWLNDLENRTNEWRSDVNRKTEENM